MQITTPTALYNIISCELSFCQQLPNISLALSRLELIASDLKCSDLTIVIRII